MKCVVDASVAAKWFVREDLRADATLVTADRQLCEAVAGTRFAPLIRHLSDFSP